MVTNNIHHHHHHHYHVSPEPLAAPSLQHRPNRQGWHGQGPVRTQPWDYGQGYGNYGENLGGTRGYAGFGHKY